MFFEQVEQGCIEAFLCNENAIWCSSNNSIYSALCTVCHFTSANELSTSFSSAKTRSWCPDAVMCVEIKCLLCLDTFSSKNQTSSSKLFKVHSASSTLVPKSSKLFLVCPSSWKWSSELASLSSDVLTDDSCSVFSATEFFLYFSRKLLSPTLQAKAANASLISDCLEWIPHGANRIWFRHKYWMCCKADGRQSSFDVKSRGFRGYLSQWSYLEQQGYDLPDLGSSPKTRHMPQCPSLLWYYDCKIGTPVPNEIDSFKWRKNPTFETIA